METHTPDILYPPEAKTPPMIATRDECTAPQPGSMPQRTLEQQTSTKTPPSTPPSKSVSNLTSVSEQQIPSVGGAQQQSFPTSEDASRNDFTPQNTRHQEPQSLELQGSTRRDDGDMALPPMLHGNGELQQRPGLDDRLPSSSFSNPSTPGGGGAVNPDQEKTKLIQQQLVLLLHAHKCLQRERESENYRCNLPHCQLMKEVFRHIMQCTRARDCSYPHCASSRQIIQHWKSCGKHDCSICMPVKGVIKPVNAPLMAEQVVSEPLPHVSPGPGVPPMDGADGLPLAPATLSTMMSMPHSSSTSSEPPTNAVGGSLPPSGGTLPSSPSPVASMSLPLSPSVGPADLKSPMSGQHTDFTVKCDRDGSLAQGIPKESHSQFLYTCDMCQQPVESRYHCSECEDFDLCVSCYEKHGHEHNMTHLGLDCDVPDEGAGPKDIKEALSRAIDRFIQVLVHAAQCRDRNCKSPSCAKMKRIMHHIGRCKQCTVCKQFLALCLQHAKTCKSTNCPVPLCANLKKHLLDKQRQASYQEDPTSPIKRSGNDDFTPQKSHQQLPPSLKLQGSTWRNDGDMALLPVLQGNGGLQQRPGLDDHLSPSSSSNPLAPGGGGAVNPDQEKTKLIQQQLVLLLHAHKCLQRERESENYCCNLPHCQVMKEVFRHIMQCTRARDCSYPHCASSRQIIQHWKSCGKHDCSICMPVKGVIKPVNAPLVARQVASKPLPRLFLGPGVPPMDGAEGPVPAPAPGEQWQNSVRQVVRDHLIKKIVDGIYPVSNYNLVKDNPQYSRLVQYIRRLEDNFFKTCTTKDEYFSKLADKYQQIVKDLQRTSPGGHAGMNPMVQPAHLPSVPNQWAPASQTPAQHPMMPMPHSSSTSSEPSTNAVGGSLPPSGGPLPSSPSPVASMSSPPSPSVGPADLKSPMSVHAAMQYHSSGGAMVQSPASGTPRQQASKQEEQVGARGPAMKSAVPTASSSLGMGSSGCNGGDVAEKDACYDVNQLEEVDMENLAG